MKHYNNTQDFYNSDDWRHCKNQVLNERLKDGALYCEHCGKIILKGFNPNEKNNAKAVVFHHKIYLNNQNVNDASISVNPDNIAVLHWSCHNEIHERFQGGKKEKKVYLITGSPCSGKTTFVKERVAKGDIVLDIDSIWETISGQPRYVKPKAISNLIFLIRREIKNYIQRSAFDAWRNAFIIESLPRAKEREDEANKYKAFNVEVITMETTKEECLQRLKENPNGRNIKEYESYIEDYFKNYS